jgi:hypothetical protein
VHIADFREENPSPSPDRYAVRVTRLEPGQSAILRMLSVSILGLLTHWIKGRSVYCPGPDDCAGTNHRESAVWKGYVAAQLWQASTKLYYDTVLEVTESAELDMRGRYRRGQLWCLSRTGSSRGKKCPVSANLVDSHDPASCPSTFDPLPLLQQLYHRLDVSIGISNPMPGRMFAVPATGDSPAAGKGKAEEATKFDKEAWRKIMEERAGRHAKDGAQ